MKSTYIRVTRVIRVIRVIRNLTSKNCPLHKPANSRKKGSLKPEPSPTV